MEQNFTVVQVSVWRFWVVSCAVDSSALCDECNDAANMLTRHLFFLMHVSVPGKAALCGTFTLCLFTVFVSVVYMSVLYGGTYL